MTRTVVRRAAASLVAGFLLYAVPYAAQNPQKPQDPRDPIGTATIMGVVVDDATGAPVEGVRVTRWIASGASPQHEVITDAKGRFLYTRVGAGTYYLVAEAAGYSMGAYSRRRPEGPQHLLVVADGAHINGVVLRIFGRIGYLSGTVRDEFGDPVIGITLYALPAFADAQAGTTFEYSRRAKTDDLGRFRFAVPTGDYCIVVPPSAVTTLARDDRRPSPRPPLFADDLKLVLADRARATPMPYLSPAGTGSGYGLTTYPRDALSANPTFVTTTTAGEGSGIDIQLQAVPATRISGTIVGPDGPVAGAEIRLQPVFWQQFGSGTSSGLEGGIALTDAAGRFSLAGVPSGHYELSALKIPQAAAAPSLVTATVETASGSLAMATSDTSYPTIAAGPTLWVTKPIDVGGEPIEGLVLTAARGARMVGRVAFDADEPPPSAAVLARMSVGLQTWRSSPSSISTLRVREDGTFATAEYRPGQYVVFGGPPPGWVIASVRQRGRDLLKAPFDLGTEDITDVVLTLTKHLVTLTGVVTTAAGRPDADATVVAIVAGSVVGGSRVWPAMIQARVETNGSFTMARVLPGDYYVVAIDDAVLDQRMNARLHAALIAAGRRMTIALAGTMPLALTTAKINTDRGGR